MEEKEEEIHIRGQDRKARQEMAVKAIGGLCNYTACTALFRNTFTQPL